MLDSLACALVKTIGWLLCRLPPSAAVWLGERLGALAWWLQPKRARIGVLNLQAAFDGALSHAEARRIIRRCFRQLGAGMIELLRLPVIDRAYVERYIPIDGFSHFERAATSGRPGILLTGHYGNWELSSIVAGLIGYPIVALARSQEKWPKLYRLLISYRESKGCTIIHKGSGVKRLITALEQGQLIGIVGDQASRQGLAVDFFGRPALFATGPLELALKNDAIVLPVFIHRVRGPFHRVVVEPPLTFSRAGGHDAALRSGIEQFAAALSRHILQDPSQWLWMHKRWKHTPARRALVLSDGKLGHLKQSLAIVESLRERLPGLTHEVIEIRYRHPLLRTLALLWSWWMPRGLGGWRCLSWTLSSDARAALLSRYADFIISCGASAAPANLLWSAAQRAKSIILMNPAPLPLRRFSLVIVPRHDALPRRANVVQIDGALANHGGENALRQARGRLHAHPQFRAEGRGLETRPVVAVFIGGDTAHYELSPAFADTLTSQVETVCDAVDGWSLWTTSRRTSPLVEQRLSARLSRNPRCRLLLLASRDTLNGTMEGMLGAADVAVVTGESISMVSEACASGRRVIVVEPPLRRSARSTLTKHQRFLRELVRGGYVRVVLPAELGLTIRRALSERQPAKRLDNLAAVREALARLV